MAKADELITASVEEMMRISGLGKSSIYTLINSGEVETVMYGRHRLVVVESYRKWVAKRLAAKAA
jgi:hypothetical protein